jgi:methylmalonyl-CoA/ethylmalonyl-CoA epimerase
MTYTLKHIGLNLPCEEEARKTAQLLCSMFGLTLKDGNASVFAGSYFECMRKPGRGTNGHIGMETDDLPAAMKDLEAKGFHFVKETESRFPDGRIKNVYLEEEVAGFAIHILQKP